MQMEEGFCLALRAGCGSVLAQDELPPRLAVVGIELVVSGEKKELRTVLHRRSERLLEIRGDLVTAASEVDVSKMHGIGVACASDVLGDVSRVVISVRQIGAQGH